MGWVFCDGSGLRDCENATLIRIGQTALPNRSWILRCSVLAFEAERDSLLEGGRGLNATDSLRQTIGSSSECWSYLRRPLHE